MIRDDRREQDEKPTAEIPKPPPWINEVLAAVAHLDAKVTDFRKDTGARFDTLEDRISGVENDLTSTKTAFSDRVKDVRNGVTEQLEQKSGHDLRTEADLAQEIIARQDADRESRTKQELLEKQQKEDRERLARIERETKLQTIALGGLTKLTKDPRVIVVFLVLSKLAHDWASAHHLLP
jgi:hypothetical protein